MSLQESPVSLPLNGLPKLHPGYRLPAVSVAALIFDLGGVLLVEGASTARRSWEDRLGVQQGSLTRALADAIGPGWQGGRSEDEIRTRLGEVLGLTPDQVRTLLSDLASDSYLEPQLMAFIAAARATRRVAILTNNGPEARAQMNDRFGMEGLVDLVVVSAEEGVSKPDPEIYRLTADRLAVPPDRCVFVDDVAENVRGAAAVGMSGVLHVDAQRTLAALDALMTTRT